MSGKIIKFVVENDRAIATSNEITVEIPNKLPKPPTKIELLEFNADITYETINSLNRTFQMVRDGTAHTIEVSVSSYSSAQEVATAITDRIRSSIGQFDPGSGLIDRITCSVLSVSRFDLKHYRNRLTAKIFRFTANDSILFQLDFSNEHTIGNLIGFGSNITSTGTIVESKFSTNIDDKLGIRTWNVAAPTGFYYNARWGFISNAGTKLGYSTFTTTNVYTDVNEFTTAFTEFINTFAGAMGVSANILVSYDLDTKSFTIEHTGGSNFGFYFDIAQYGFPDKLFGFNKFKSYQNQSSYTGIPVALPPIIEKEDYFYITSDLVNKGTTNVVILGADTQYQTPHNVLFHIPVNNKYLRDIRDISEVDLIGSNLVSYKETNGQIVDITSSKLYDNFHKRSTEQQTITLSLKTQTGISISDVSKWQITFALHFD